MGIAPQRGWSYGAIGRIPVRARLLKANGFLTLGSCRVRQDYLLLLGLTSPLVTMPLKIKTSVPKRKKTMALGANSSIAAHEVGIPWVLPITFLPVNMAVNR